MIDRSSSNTAIFVEESPKRKIENPDYLLKMDKIDMKNGDRFLVTEANHEGIEVMMVTRRKIKKEDIPEFLSNMSSVERADCFEIG